MAEGEAPAIVAATHKKEDLPELVEKTLHGFVHPVPEGLTPVRGYDFSGDGVDYHALLQSYRTCGFQATNFGLAVEQINQMVKVHAMFELQCHSYHWGVPAIMQIMHACARETRLHALAPWRGVHARDVTRR